MDFQNWLPVLIVCSSLFTGLIIFILPEQSAVSRSVLNMAGATLKLLLVIIVVLGVHSGIHYEARFSILLGFDFVLRVDPLSLLMLILSTVLWFLTTIYAIGYLKDSKNQSRFFGFFSLCVTASVGVALSGNLITFFIFYEFLTLSTYPLVVHKGDADSLKAGRTYLWYTVTGGSLLFVAIVWLNVLAGSFDFTPGGTLGLMDQPPDLLSIIFVMLILGLGVKAALVPLHGWLPSAMVAPAPVSALLHAVAVVKAGAFGIVRVVHDVYGVLLASSLNLLTPLAILASITIIYGSLRALHQVDLKKLLAFSTVSQLSYIILGASTTGMMATTGCLVHLIHQGIMKITLFFCAGILEKTLGIRSIEDMNGIGRRMPWTMSAFTIASIGMIGLPPVAGFISKWHLALGGVETGQLWIVGVLVASTLLNAAYFLPVLYRAWFRPGKINELQAEQAMLPGSSHGEGSHWLLWPTAATAAFSLLAGLFATSRFSPLELSKQIASVLVL